jgi:hypothetical protein
MNDARMKRTGLLRAPRNGGMLFPYGLKKYGQSTGFVLCYGHMNISGHLWGIIDNMVENRHLDKSLVLKTKPIFNCNL